MTDYYPFIVREVSKLDRKVDESRREVCERVREELVTKLHQPALRIPKSDIASELRAFDAAVRRIEAEIARGQTWDTGIPASSTTSDSAGSIPITGTGAESPEIAQTKAEAAQISRFREAKSSPLAGTSNADPDLHRQMLHAIGTALDLAVHRERSGVAVARTMRTRLLNMTLAIVICCVVFAVIYFTDNIGKWFGF